MHKKDSFYFSHDSNARNDLKIVKLRRQLGLEGYGAFWCVIEVLRETADHKLPLDAIDDIAFDIDISKEKLDTIIRNYGLFTIDDNKFFYSNRLSVSMQEYNQHKLKYSEAGKKGMQKRWSKPDTNNPNSFI